MVQWWINFLKHISIDGEISQWWNRKMVKKINIIMNCVVRFNCYFGYHIIFGILALFRTPIIAILMIMGKLTCVISHFCWSTSYYVLSPLCFLLWQSGVTVRWFLIVQQWWWDNFVAENVLSSICALEWILSPGTCPWGYFLVQFTGKNIQSG